MAKPKKEDKSDRDYSYGRRPSVASGIKYGLRSSGPADDDELPPKKYRRRAVGTSARSEEQLGAQSRAEAETREAGEPRVSGEDEASKVVTSTPEIGSGEAQKSSEERDSNKTRNLPREQHHLDDISELTEAQRSDKNQELEKGYDSNETVELPESNDRDNTVQSAESKNPAEIQSQVPAPGPVDVKPLVIEQYFGPPSQGQPKSATKSRRQASKKKKSQVPRSSRGQDSNLQPPFGVFSAVIQTASTPTPAPRRQAATLQPPLGVFSPVVQTASTPAPAPRRRRLLPLPENNTPSTSTFSPQLIGQPIHAQPGTVDFPNVSQPPQLPQRVPSHPSFATPVPPPGFALQQTPEVHQNFYPFDPSASFNQFGSHYPAVPQAPLAPPPPPHSFYPQHPGGAPQFSQYPSDPYQYHHHLSAPQNFQSGPLDYQSGLADQGGFAQFPSVPPPPHHPSGPAQFPSGPFYHQSGSTSSLGEPQYYQGSPTQYPSGQFSGTGTNNPLPAFNPAQFQAPEGPLNSTSQEQPAGSIPADPTFGPLGFVFDENTYDIVAAPWFENSLPAASQVEQTQLGFFPPPFPPPPPPPPPPFSSQFPGPFTPGFSSTPSAAPSEPYQQTYPGAFSPQYPGEQAPAFPTAAPSPGFPAPFIRNPVWQQAGAAPYQHPGSPTADWSSSLPVAPSHQEQAQAGAGAFSSQFFSEETPDGFNTALLPGDAGAFPSEQAEQAQGESASHQSLVGLAAGLSPSLPVTENQSLLPPPTEGGVNCQEVSQQESNLSVQHPPVPAPPGVQSPQDHGAPAGASSVGSFALPSQAVEESLSNPVPRDPGSDPPAPSVGAAEGSKNTYEKEAAQPQLGEARQAHPPTVHEVPDRHQEQERDKMSDEGTFANQAPLAASEMPEEEPTAPVPSPLPAADEMQEEEGEGPVMFDISESSGWDPMPSLFDLPDEVTVPGLIEESPFPAANVAFLSGEPAFPAFDSSNTVEANNDIGTTTIPGVAATTTTATATTAATTTTSTGGTTTTAEAEERSGAAPLGLMAAAQAQGLNPAFLFRHFQNADDRRREALRIELLYRRLATTAHAEGRSIFDGPLTDHVNPAAQDFVDAVHIESGPLVSSLPNRDQLRALERRERQKAMQKQRDEKDAAERERRAAGDRARAREEDLKALDDELWGLFINEDVALGKENEEPAEAAGEEAGAEDRAAEAEAEADKMDVDESMYESSDKEEKDTSAEETGDVTEKL